MAPRGNRSSKKPPLPWGKGKGKRASTACSVGDDPFFEAEPKRRRAAHADEDSESRDSDDDALALHGAAMGEDGDDEETAGEKKLRMTNEYLKRIEDAVQRNKEEEEIYALVT
jgi:ribosomal RNA-processing protein 9